MPSPAYVYVLTALADGPRHGLGIADDVASFTEGEVRLGPGTLYRCLNELTEQGLIERADVEVDAGESPHRKYYVITQRGRLRLLLDVQGLAKVVRVARRKLRARRVEKSADPSPI